MNYSESISRPIRPGTAVGRKWLPLVAAVLLVGCSSHEPLETVDHVDLERFMGDWYVIANIPTSIEKEAFNAVETYRLDEDGSIDTTFTFLKGGFDGDKKQYNPRGFVRNRDSNAEWGMQFIWPIKADYRIIYVDDDYQLTVIGRTKRDYVWLMARDWSISEQRLDAMLELIGEAGYDASLVRKVPQRW